MKNKILLIILMATTAFTYSQIGVKAGLTYGVDKGLYTFANNVDSEKGSLGYHIGLYKRLNLTGLYIQPELWYLGYNDKFKNDFKITIEKNK